MTACREFGPGELMRCPGPGIRRQICDTPLHEVGDGCRARVCVGAKDDPRPHTLKKCKTCGAMVRIEVWRVDQEGAA